MSIDYTYNPGSPRPITEAPELLRLLADWFDMREPDGKAEIQRDLRHWADMIEHAPELLADLRAKAERATPGEVEMGDADFEYITAANPAVVLALLDRIAELEARLAEDQSQFGEPSAVSPSFVYKLQQDLDYLRRAHEHVFGRDDD